MTLTVNGETYELQVPARMTLADALRERLRLVGTHLGCEQGVCGACTVLIDGAPVRSCLVFAVQVRECQIETVEGLGRANGELHRLQELFLEHRALQCGFCTPGMLMAIIGIDRKMTRCELEQYLASQLCRCTGYESIVSAAGQYLREERLLLEEDNES